MYSSIVKQLKAVKCTVLHLADAGMSLTCLCAPAGPRRQCGRFGPFLNSSQSYKFLQTDEYRSPPSAKWSDETILPKVHTPRSHNSSREVDVSRRIASRTTGLLRVMVSYQSWSELGSGKMRRKAVEVERGGALLGGQNTKRARSLRFLSTLHLTNGHTLHVFMCQDRFKWRHTEDNLLYAYLRFLRLELCASEQMSEDLQVCMTTLHTAKEKR